MLKRSRLLHFFTNIFLLGNFTWISRGNKFYGRLKALRLNTKIRVKGENNRIWLNQGILLNSKIYIEGSGNSLVVSEDCSIRNAVIWITGNDNKILLCQNVKIFNADLGAENSRSTMFLRDNVQVGGYMTLGLGTNKTLLTRIYASEGRRVEIEKGSAISDGVTIRSSDSHSIFNKDGNRINPPEDVYIGKNVWICSGASLFKGARIGDGSVLGGNSMLKRDFGSCKHMLFAGSPAEPIREDISWSFDVEIGKYTGDGSQCTKRY